MSDTPATPSGRSTPTELPAHRAKARWAPFVGRLTRRAMWCMLGIVASIIVIAGVAWAVLLFQILPRIDNWRTDVAQQATRALGVTVRIGALEGQAQGIWPVVTMREVELLDAHDRVVLTLPEISARMALSSLSPQALWAGEMRLGRLTLNGPDLSMRRTRLGEVYVAGLKVWPPSTEAADSGVLDWILTQSLIEVQQGRLTWLDEAKQAPPLALSGVNVSLKHDLGLGQRHHVLKLQATPPAAFGQAIQVDAHVSQPLWAPEPDAKGWRRWWPTFTRAGVWQQWDGEMHASMPHVDVQHLREHVDLPVDVRDGDGRLMWGVKLSEGRFAGGFADVALHDVNVRLGSTLQPLRFKSVQTKMTLVQLAHETRLTVDDLSFTLVDGLVWPRSQMSAQWRHEVDPQVDVVGAWQQTTGGQARAAHLDLSLLARIADRLPLAAPQRAALADLRPHGVISDLEVSWVGPAHQAQRYQLKANVRALSLHEAKQGMRPGIGHADVVVEANEAGGQAKLSMRDGWMAFPGVFEEARIPLKALQAHLDWAKDGDGWRVSVSDAQFENDDAQGHVQAQWRTHQMAGAQVLTAGLPGWLDMQGKLERAQATRVWRYLPLAVPADTRDYLREAFSEGQGRGVTFEVKGDLNAFPFKDDVGGRFRVNVPVQDVTMRYVPPSLLGLPPDAIQGVWPQFTQLNGMLRFEGQRMVIEGAKGVLGTVGSGQFSLSAVEGEIADMGADEPHLRIKGQGTGPLDDLLKFLAQSPIGTWTGGALREASGTGRGAMSLALDIPLAKAEDTRLRGIVHLTERDNASMRLSPGIPAFTALRGSVAITEADLDVQLKTQIWGEEALVKGQRDAQGVVRFNGAGSFSAQGLRQAHEYPLLAKAAQHFEGKAPMNVTVAIGAQTEVNVSSSLQGMAVRLPEPAHKAADVSWPLAVQYRTEGAEHERDAISVTLGSAAAPSAAWVAVDVRRDVSGPTATLLQGLVQVNDGRVARVATAMPSKGLAAVWQTAHLNVDDWLPVLNSLRMPGSSEQASSASDWLPDVVSLRTEALTVRQRTLKNVQAQLRRPSDTVWALKLNADQVAGQLEWDTQAGHESEVGNAHRITARLSRLQVPDADVQALRSQAESQLLAPKNGLTLPALDLQIDDLNWGGLALGRLEVSAVNRRLAAAAGGKVQTQWQLEKLRLAAPEAVLDAKGQWSAEPGSDRAVSAFHFSLNLRNSGALLARLGMPQTVKGGKGQIEGDVKWRGSPLEPDPHSMSGDVRVKIQEGQFLKVEPGAAKLLGVLSLQSLPRRLTLDFRDLFQQGFAFDGIDGDVSVTEGVASTRNLRMRGLQAVVLMEGQANLIHETQHLHVYVVPQIDAGAASLAYAAINPVIGIGTFLAQYLLRKQVSEASTQEFTITGSWADPQVDKLARELKPVGVKELQTPS